MASFKAGSSLAYNLRLRVNLRITLPALAMVV
jgi:hypothetical protein